MKKTLIVVAIVIVCLLALLLAKDFIIKSAVSAVASKVTGAKVTIGWLSLGILKQSVRITDFKMYNPSGFTRNILLDMPELVVKYDLASLLKGKLHLPLVEVQLKEIGLEKNKEGKLNVDSLAVSQQKAGGKPAKQMPMQIDILNLGIGRLVSKDFSAGTEPEIKVYDINFKKSFKNITSAEQLALIILTEPMKAAGIKGATVYGAALLTGVGFIPITVFTTLTGKDNAQQKLEFPMDTVYDAALRALQSMGRVERGDKGAGIITGTVNGSSVTIKLTRVSDKSTQVAVSARRFMMPRPETAGGVLYQITDKLK